MTDVPVLELRGVSKSFGAVQALYQVDFHVAPGEVMALVGDNGAGKSTLIKCIAGIHPSDEGETIFDGEEVHIHGPKDAARLGIEVVYQDLALADNLDVVQNMYLGRELVDGARRLDETTMEAKAQETLAGLSVTTLQSVRQTVAGLSGGQRQSVAVAKAVMWNSRVVILDEPTAALGVAQTHQVLDLVKRLGEQGLAVILISHNLHDIFEVARLDHRPAARPERRRVQAHRDEPAGGRRGDHGRQAVQGARPRTGGDRVSTVAAPPPAAPTAGNTQTIGAYARNWWIGVKSGDLGSLPIFLGLIIICVVFQSQNDRFLTAGNFVNLLVQTAPYAVIAMGVTFVLLLGEIDLSIGFVSGVGGVLTAILLAPDGNELATPIVLAIVFGTGLAIGTLHGLIITKVGVPSFVVTLAGLLAWNGVVLLLIGSKGTVILQNDFVIGVANDFLAPGVSWVLVIVLSAIYAGRPARAAALPDQGRAAHRPAADRRVPDRRRRGRPRDHGRRGQPGPRHPVRGGAGRRPVPVLDLRPQPHALRPPRLRRRRQPGGVAARGHRRRPREDRVLRLLLVHGGAGRHRARLAPAVGRHQHRRRPGAAVPDRRGGDRRHLAVRRPRHDEGRDPRRAGDALDRQRARACSACRRGRSSCSPAACCCWP